MAKLHRAFAAMLALTLAGCTASGGNGTGTGTGGGSAAEPITVLTREDGSGTRSAFVELFELKADGGGDKIKADAEVKNNTSVIMASVSGDKNSIGYISMGSLNETVKALKINGVEATAANVANGTYPVSRPFLLAYKTGLSAQSQDFVNFIMSNQGQKVIEDNGYVKVGGESDYQATATSGNIVVGGSSSVTPVMEKLKEAYIALNPQANVEVQQSDSSTGIQSAIEGAYEIAMSSRDLKESETAAGLTPKKIATDGIAVIVNKDNAASDMTKEQVGAIYKGETTSWQSAQ